MKILFATDGSVSADIALQKILENEWPAGALLRVVTVAVPLHKHLNAALFGIGDLAQRAQADLEVDLKALLEECLAKLEPKFGKGNVSTEFLQGDPKVEINAAASKWGADMIAMGSHSNDLEDSWAGSVTRAVVLSAPCTVQVLNAESSWSAKKKESEQVPDESSRYVVAVSTETNAQLIIAAILDRPWAPESRFQIISVVQSSIGLESRFFKSKNIEELHKQSWSAQKTAAEAFVKAAAARLEGKFPAKQITSHVLEGNPRNMILQIAQDWAADMIIMGSHDHDRGAVENFLGSTAAAIVWNADCSVELVKHPSLVRK